MKVKVQDEDEEEVEALTTLLLTRSNDAVLMIQFLCEAQLILAALSCEESGFWYQEGRSCDFFLSTVHQTSIS